MKLKHLAVISIAVILYYPSASLAKRGKPSRADLERSIAELRQTIKDLQARLAEMKVLVDQSVRNVAGGSQATAKIPLDLVWKQVQTNLAEAKRAEEKGLYSVAIGEYTEALQLDPGNDSAFLHRGICYLNLGELAMASADITQSLRLQPEAVAAYENRAKVQAARGRNEEAIADLDEAIKRGATNADNYTLRASLYRNAAEFTKAITDYTAVLQIRPTPDIYMRRAEAYLLAGESEKSRDDCTEAQKLDEKTERPYVCRGKAFAALQQHDKAVSDYEEALRLNPNNAEARILLNYARQQVTFSDKTSSDKTSSSAQSVSPSPAPVPAATMAQAAPQKNPAPEPAKKVEISSSKVLTGKPPSAQPPAEALKLTTSGRALTSEGKFKEALEAFDRAIEVNPTFAMAYNSRGYTYLRVKDYKRAYEDFNSAVHLDPGYANAKVNRDVAQKLLAHDAKTNQNVASAPVN